MKAYSIALPILAATVLLTGGAGVAVAQDNNTAVCDAATKAENNAKEKLDDAERADRKLKNAEQELKKRNVPENRWNDQGLRDELKLIARTGTGDDATGDHPGYWPQPGPVVGPDEDRRANADLNALQDWSKARDEANNKKVNELRKKLDDAIAERDKVCGDVTTTPTTPPPPFNDLDCPGFANLADAQAVLDADRSDPHALDLDGDGIACEVGVDDVEVTDPVVNGGDVIIDNVTVPSGGVATGGGPA